MPHLNYEHKYPGKVVAGFDEVGRGCLAGPVVAAGVILPENVILPGVDDSKSISKTKRRELAEMIIQRAIHVSVGIVSPEDIDKLNILEATKLAMKRALNNLNPVPDVILIDGDQKQRLKDITQEQECIIKGDSTSLSIASASIIAKEVRDELMKLYHQRYPEYEWDKNSGYGTKFHREQLERVGYTPIHRLSFDPVKSHKKEWKRRD